MTDILDLFREHWFWGALTAACLVWYSTVTVYVAFKGFKDIRSMLKRLGKRERP